MESFEVPKIFNDRNSSSFNEKYMFISYSHKNKSLVFNDLNKLFKSGLNYWYDKDLPHGLDWDEQVKNHLKDANCLGIIFYLSPYIILSKSIANEFILAKKRKDLDKDFRLFFIYLGETNLTTIIRDAYLEQINLNCDEVEKNIPANRLSFFLDILHDETLGYRKLKINDFDHIDSMIEEISKVDPLLISNNDSYLSSLVSDNQAKKINNNYIFKIGKFPQKSVNSNINLSEGTIYEDGKNSYKIAQGHVFCYLGIEWILLKAENNNALIISRYALDEFEGYQFSGGLDDWLKDFYCNSFTDKEKNMILEGPRMLSKDEITIYKEKLLPFVLSDFVHKFQNSPTIDIYWLQESNKHVQFAVNKDGIILKAPLKTTNKANIRPVIKIDIKQFLNNKEG